MKITKEFYLIYYTRICCHVHSNFIFILLMHCWHHKQATVSVLCLFISVRNKSIRRRANAQMLHIATLLPGLPYIIKNHSSFGCFMPLWPGMEVNCDLKWRSTVTWNGGQLWPGMEVNCDREWRSTVTGNGGQLWPGMEVIQMEPNCWVCWQW